MSAGLGTVTPEQTYLDIGAGNRVFNSLYDGDCRRCRGTAAAPGSKQRWQRAESAPDEIEPGLLVRTLEAPGS